MFCGAVFLPLMKGEVQVGVEIVSNLPLTPSFIRRGNRLLVRPL